MSNETRRIIIKKGTGVPTVPASNDHTDGTWIATDIYEAELYQDTSTGNLYSRDSGGIYKINLDYTDFIEDAINNGEVTKSPTENAVFDALALKENSITAGTTSQYYRGDKTFQTLDKSAVGLGNVDNTSDANKPVSTAQQTALDLKANLASPALTGNPTAPTQSAGDNSTKLATTAYVYNARTPRLQTVSSSATVTPNASTDDIVTITAQATGLTLANPSGTKQIGQAITIRIKDNGTARSIAYGSEYRAIGVTLPTTTVISKTLYLVIIWNNADTKWDVLAVKQEA